MSSKLRNWMQRTPHPVKIRTDDGDIIPLRGRSKWSDAVAAVEDLDPAVLEALDTDGQVLRTYRCTGEDGKARERKMEDPTVALSRVIAEAADKAAQRTIEASDKAAERYAKGYEAAFNAMAGITEMNIKRLTRLESLYMALVKRHADTIEDTADAIADATEASGDGELKKMVTSLVVQRALGDVKGAGPAKPNGKGKAKE